MLVFDKGDKIKHHSLQTSRASPLLRWPMQSGGLGSSSSGLLKVAIAAFWHDQQSVLGYRVGSLLAERQEQDIAYTYPCAMRP